MCRIVPLLAPVKRVSQKTENIVSKGNLAIENWECRIFRSCKTHNRMPHSAPDVLHHSAATSHISQSGGGGWQAVAKRGFRQLTPGAFNVEEFSLGEECGVVEEA